MVTFKSSDEIYQIARMATKHHHVGWCQNLCVVTGSGRDKMIRSHCLPVVGLAQHILEYKFKCDPISTFWFAWADLQDIIGVNGTFIQHFRISKNIVKKSGYLLSIYNLSVPASKHVNPVNSCWVIRICTFSNFRNDLYANGRVWVCHIHKFQYLLSLHING